MDATRFEGWTRRHLGRLSGVTLAALIGWAAAQDVEAKRKKRKRRCRKLGGGCAPGGKRKCCSGLRCDVADLDGTNQKVCCRGEGKPCLTSEECCRDFVCAVGLCELPSSDQTVKANFASVDPADVLSRLQRLAISNWNYTADDPAIRHIGPMAQDFAAAFGVGADNRHIHPIDGQGVALAAIQGLARELAELRNENARLAVRLGSLEARSCHITPCPCPDR